MTELVTLVANISVALSFLIALVFGISQVMAAARDRKDHLTLETLSIFQTRDFAELVYMMQTKEMPQTVEELARMPKEDRIMFSQFAQQMESLGLLVGERLIDLDLVDKTLGNFVSNSWRKCEKLFMDIREKQDDPNMAEYFQWLAEHIEARIKNDPRKPYHLSKD